ncbi:UNVERIFIED_CONTAM: hypothetical protein K2H54_024696 [Gekko kuhli]
MGPGSGLNTEDKSGHELLALRLSKKLQAKDQIIKTLQAKLQGHSVTPSPNHTISEPPSSGSSTSFLSDGMEGCSDMEDVDDQETPREGHPYRHLDAVKYASLPTEDKNIQLKIWNFLSG